MRIANKDMMMEKNNVVRRTAMAVALFLLSSTVRADYDIDTADAQDASPVMERSVDGTLTVSADLDLKGRRLVLTGIEAISDEATGTITDSVGDGVLELEIVGKLVTQTFRLGGALRVVKRGSGALNMVHGLSDFTGGLEIVDGRVQTGKYGSVDPDSDRKDPGKTPFGFAPKIVVREGGEIDFGGCYSMNSVVLELDGGAIVGPNRTVSAEKSGFNAAVKLLSDAAYHQGKGKVFNLSGPVDLGGHTLTLDLNTNFYWRPSLVSGGTVRQSQGTMTVPRKVEMPAANLVVDGELVLIADLDVADFLIGEKASFTSNGVLTVHGRLMPQGRSLPACRLADGASVALSESEPLPWRAETDGGMPIGFAPAAHVRIEVGARELAAGQSVVSWPAGTDYAGRVFELVTADGVSATWRLQAGTDGLQVVAKAAEIETATWTGAVDGDVGNAANWSWSQGDSRLPGGSTVVRLPWASLGRLVWPVGSEVSFAAVEMVGERPEVLTLTDDCDWRGLGAVGVAAIDLAGRRLDLRLSADPLAVTSSVEGGELRAFVPAGETCVAEGLAASGPLTLVKTGAGVLVAGRQAHARGTRIAEGVLRCAAETDLSAGSAFGSSGEVTVASGAALDPAGSFGWSKLVVRLDGGAVSNTVAQRGVSTTAYNVEKYPYPFDPEIRLGADAAFVTDREFNFGGRLLCDGHLLRVAIAAEESLLWTPTEAVGARIEVVRGGYLKTIKNHSFVAPTASLTVSGGSLDLAGDLVISNYVAATDATDYRFDMRAGLVFRVFGRFRPLTRGFVGCTLMDGATLDLSEWTGAWSSQSTLMNTGRAEGRGDKVAVEFAPGAGVTVDLAGRRLVNRETLVTWSPTTAATLGGVRLALDPETRARHWRLVASEEGLSVRRDGTSLSIR